MQYDLRTLKKVRNMAETEHAEFVRGFTQATIKAYEDVMDLTFVRMHFPKRVPAIRHLRESFDDLTLVEAKGLVDEEFDKFKKELYAQGWCETYGEIPF